MSSKLQDNVQCSANCVHTSYSTGCVLGIVHILHCLHLCRLYFTFLSLLFIYHMSLLSQMLGSYLPHFWPATEFHLRKRVLDFIFYTIFPNPRCMRL